MYKLIALFTQPDDVVEFETRWANEFIPLAEKMPGIRRITHSRILGSPAGPSPYSILHEFYFADYDALIAAMRSPAGVAAGQCLMSIAPRDVTLMFAEHFEDDVSNLKLQTPNFKLQTSKPQL